MEQIEKFVLSADVCSSPDSWCVSMCLCMCVCLLCARRLASTSASSSSAAAAALSGLRLRRSPRRRFVDLIREVYDEAMCAVYSEGGYPDPVARE